MGYTWSDAIDRVSLKGFISANTSLEPAQILELLEDSMRSYVVPFAKAVRDEWFVSTTDYDASTDSNSRIKLPDSVASTIRTISWLNAGIYYPLPRIEPENAFDYQQASSVPLGFMLKGYELVILPAQSASFTIRCAYMKRPPSAVLEDDAGEIASHVGLALTLAGVPLAWQSATPSTVDLINSNSPFSVVSSGVTVVSLVGMVLTVSGISSALVSNGYWVSDAGTSPYPNIPIELHPLLEQDVICTIYQAQGDKRLKGAMDKKAEFEKMLMKAMAPRTQGSSRVVVNNSAPGMSGRRWGGWTR